MANLPLSVMGAFAQFERERQREGIALAKKRGVYRGRKRSLTPSEAADLLKRVAKGESKTLLAKEFGVSRDTIYRYMARKGSVGTHNEEGYPKGDVLPVRKDEDPSAWSLCGLLQASPTG